MDTKFEWIWGKRAETNVNIPIKHLFSDTRQSGLAGVEYKSVTLPLS